MYEELIKELRYCADGDAECAGCKRYGQMCCEGDLKAEAADAIEQLEAAVPKWVPVTERLPVDVGYYIVYCWDGHINRVSFAKWQKNNRRWDLSATRAYWKVSHWMPLPEPPKEET